MIEWAHGREMPERINVFLNMFSRVDYQNIGVIFDWDGVIIDSSRTHEASWELLAEEISKSLPEGHFKKGFGKKNDVIIPEILGWSDDPKTIRALGQRKEEFYRELLKSTPPILLPGAVDLLKNLKEVRIPAVVGSSSERLNIEMVIDILNLGDYFQDIVSSEDVHLGKPHPDVFLKAAAKINRLPQQCVVFEDAVHGIEAGLAGGMKVIAVATTHPHKALAAATWVVDYLTDVDVDDIRNLYSDSRSE